MEGIEKPVKPTNKNFIILLLSIMLLVTCIILIITLFFGNKAPANNNCDDKLLQKDIEFNNTINYVVAGIINNIVNSTDNCGVVGIKYGNNTRKLANVECFNAYINQIMNKSGG